MKNANVMINRGRVRATVFRQRWPESEEKKNLNGQELVAEVGIIGPAASVAEISPVS